VSDNQMERSDVTLIVVHCAATKPGDDVTAADIDRMHRKRGWRKIGYHYFIRRDGTVEAGRKFLEKGAHEESVNAHSTSICMAGGVKDYETWEPEDNYTDAQWAALDSVIPILRSAFPKAKVTGHTNIEGVNKACPCFDAEARYP